MAINTKVFFSWYFPAILVLLGLRWYLVAQAGFPDYDSVRNWEIVQEVATGKFQHLFHHRSPGFYLLFVPFSYFFTDFHYYIYLNAIFGVAALVVLVHFLKCVFDFSHWEAALLLVFTGSSVFLTYSGRFFTIESPSLLIFALWLRQYYQRFQQHSPTALYRAAVLIALGLTINYKFLLLLPVVLVLEFWFRDGLLNLRRAFQIGLILIFPYLFFIVFSVAAGLPFYLFPVSYAPMLNFTAENPAHRSGKFRADFFYYFRYLFYFESPFTWLGLAGFPLVFRRKLAGAFNAYTFLGIICYAFLLGMSLLLKAPRGLLFVYPLLYLLGFLLLRRLVNLNWLFSLMVLGLMGYNIIRINKEIYSYIPTSYGKVAAYLKQRQIGKVAGTVSLGLKPYLPPEVGYRVIMNEAELTDLKQQGFYYVLLDDYRKTTNIQTFGKLEKLKPEVSFTEPTWESRLIYLEHSEFTGLGFKETLNLREQALQDTVQLRLIKVP